MPRREYYEIATGDLLIEATLKVKIKTRVNANYEPEDVIHDMMGIGEYYELDVHSIDYEELTDIQIEIDEYE